MYGVSTVIVGDAPEVVKGFDTSKFDLVFCHSVLVSIPPKYNYIFGEMVRVSNKFVFTLETESACTAYPRNFKKMFEKQGMKMAISKVFTGGCLSLPIPFTEEYI